MTDAAALYDRLQEFVGTPNAPEWAARDDINQAMIRHWCDAMGDTNPVYTDPDLAAESIHGGVVAPPTMLQAWTMPGLGPRPEPGDDIPNPGPYEVIVDAGYPSVVATNCEQEYLRYVRPGERLTMSSIVETISEEKTTALGVGFFVTTLQEYKTLDGELIGTMRFRVFRFKAHPKPDKKPASDMASRPRPRPMRNRDTAHFWEGLAEGHIRIQKCSDCGHLRHPPRPACPECQSLEWDTIDAAGVGEIYSFVVHHYPPVPGFEPPFAVALVELGEGIRIVGNVVGVDPGEVEIGMAVEVEFLTVDDEVTLTLWRPTGSTTAGKPSNGDSDA